MKRKARIFNPDKVTAEICRVVRRDFSDSTLVYGVREGPLDMLRDRQVKEIDKKLVSYHNLDDSLRDLAFIKFLFVNEHMSNFGKEALELPTPDMVRPQSRYGSRSNILLRAKAIVRMVLTPFDEDEWFTCAKHGTGSSLGVSYSDTSLEAKSSFPISVTERARVVLERYMNFDSLSKSAMLYHNAAWPTGQMYDIVNSSRATTVRKSNTIDRMIAVEPTGNMFLQQGLMEMMYRRMERWTLDLESLPIRHKKRAQIASITSKEATVDWSSASDCVSIELLRWLLPPAWFECCDICRSPSISIDGEEIPLNMFSTMGNAVTFPLETLVFWSLAHAVRLEHEGTLGSFPEWEELESCSVFGDDCIVPTEVADLFIEICESVGFICNRSKTFTDEGGFRESCGGDYLRGYDVRPFNLKCPASNKVSALEPFLYTVMNGILPKYITYFGSRDYIYRCGILELFLGYFEEFKLNLKLVPPHYPDDSGLKLNSDIQRLIRCYPFKLQRVGRDRHGSYTFSFCRFIFRHNVRRVEDLHYSSWLKRPGKGKKSPWWNDRRIGGYVVAKGKSGHWSLSNVF